MQQMEQHPSGPLGPEKLGQCGKCKCAHTSRSSARFCPSGPTAPNKISIATHSLPSANPSQGASCSQCKIEIFSTRENYQHVVRIWQKAAEAPQLAPGCRKGTGDLWHTRIPYPTPHRMMVPVPKRLPCAEAGFLGLCIDYDFKSRRPIKRST